MLSLELDSQMSKKLEKNMSSLSDKSWGNASTVSLKYDWWQRQLLRFGGVFNGLFGVLFFLIPYWTANLSHMVIPPSEPGGIWIRLDGIFLIITALFYFLASCDPNRYVGIVAICIFGKIWSVGFYGFYMLQLGAPPGYWLPTILDLLLFFLHIWALGPDRRTRIMGAFKIVPISRIN